MVEGVRPWPRRWAARDSIGVAVIVGAALALFVPTWLSGGLWIDGDLEAFYWPTMSVVFEAVRQGRLPLWNPNLLGGFPLYADGSVGTLFPLNWVLVPWPHAFMLIPCLRLLLAALGMYLFARRLAVGVAGATVASLVFALNGFTVGHFSHIDLANGTALLPWLLVCLEQSRRAEGWRAKTRWLLLAAIANGLAWVSLHPMAPLMILLVSVAWTVYRGLSDFWPTLAGSRWEGGGKGRKSSSASGKSNLPSLAEWEGGRKDGKGISSPTFPRVAARRSPFLPHLWGEEGGRGPEEGPLPSSGDRARLPLNPVQMLRRGLGWTLAALAVPNVVAVGLAAAQVVPMLELAGESPRQTWITNTAFNATYSLPPYNLIGLVWPTFFHSAHGGVQWGLWNLETLVYLGTLPLLLTLAAVVTRPRGYHVPFFVLLALLALWTAFGIHVPWSPQRVLYQLPGFSVLRAPARFFYVAGFAGAYLAGVGLHTLLQLDLTPVTRRRLKWLLVGAVALAVLIPLVGQAVVLFVDRAPQQAERAIWALYLNQPHATRLRVEDVVFALHEKFRLTNRELWKNMGLLVVSAGLLALWLRGRLAARTFTVAAVALTALDLVFLATQFVTVVPLARFTEPSPLAQRLEQALDRARYFTVVGEDEQASLKYLPFDLADFNGQTSLAMARPSAYMAAATRTETRLLDLANVRYLQVKTEPPRDTRTRFGMQFNELRPLVTLDTETPAVLTTFAPPPHPSRGLSLLLALSQAVDVPQGAEVGEALVTDTSGQTRRWPLRAGIEASEWAYKRPDVAASVKHDFARSGFAWTERDDTGQTFEKNLFYAELNLTDGDAPPLAIERVQFRATRPDVTLLIFGIGLRRADDSVVSLDRYSLARYRQTYAEPSVRLLASDSALPRAFLVGQAVRYDQRWQALDRLGQPSFDVTRRITLEGAVPAEAAALVVSGPPDKRAPLPAAPAPASLGTARIIGETDTQVTVQVDAAAPAFLALADTYYPGWSATVDTQATPVLLADYTFRAVVVPPGAHTVTFSYAPTSVRLGFAVSLLTWVGVALAAWLCRPRALSHQP